MSLQYERATLRPGPKNLVTHKVLDPDAERLRAIVKSLTLDDAKHPRFPGPSPVSIERAHFDVLRKNEYVACEKTDGTRVLLAFVRYKGLKIVFFMDRKMDVYLFSIKRAPRVLFQGTLFDGEIAWNKMTERYDVLVFDAITVSGVSVGHATLYERVDAIKRSLMDYVYDERDSALVTVKSFVPLNASLFLRGHLDYVRGVYDVDGVVLTPVADEVKFGRHMKLFKLKTTHSVDFLVLDDGSLGVYDPARCAHVSVGAADSPQLPGDVVECVQSPENGTWTVIHKRTDKTTANDLLTYQKTLLNARERITVDEIIDLFS